MVAATGGRVGNRHRPFLHRLEQRGLGLRRGAVDLIGEHNIREHRTRLEGEDPPSVFGFVQDIGAGDVRRHQVRRELDAAERKVQRIPNGAHESGLAESRHAFEQDVAASEEGDQHLVDDFVLADDHALDFPLDRGGKFAKVMR